MVKDEFYHAYNRGIARQPIFLNKRGYRQALLTLSYYRFVKPLIKLSRFKTLATKERGRLLQKLEQSGQKLVEIVSFVFMPNHFHFLLKQTADKGISKFLSRFTNSYTRYFNTKQKRVGALFQGVFKSVHVETTEQLLYLSRYIHLNPLVSFVVREKEFLNYSWSSLPYFLKGKSTLVDINPVLSNFSSPEEYQEFVLDQADYAKTLEQIRHLTLDRD